MVLVLDYNKLMAFLPIISCDDDLAFTLAWKALDGGTAGAKLSQNKQSLHGVKQTEVPFINSG